MPAPITFNLRPTPGFPLTPSRAPLPLPAIGPAPLSDNFDDNSRDTAKWNANLWAEGNSLNTGTLAETGGHVECTPPVSTAGFSGVGYTSVNTLDVTDTRVFVKMGGSFPGTTGQQSHVYVGENNNKYVSMIFGAGALVIARQRNGGNSNIYVGNYSATADVWAGIRHLARDNTWHFEVAGSSAADPPNPSDWVEVGSLSNAGFITQTAVNVGFGSFTTTSENPVYTQSFDGFDTGTTGTGTTYNDTLSESVIAADTITATVTFNGSLTESLIAADSLTGSVIFSASLNEAVTGADSLAGTVTFNASLTESVAGADSLAATATFNASLGESVTGADSLSGLATFNESFSESLTASDSLTGGLSLSGAISESLTASDSIIGSAIFAAPLNEGIGAADSLTATAVYIASLIETVAATSAFVDAPAPFVPPTISYGFHTKRLTAANWGASGSSGTAWKNDPDTPNDWSNGSGQTGANWKKS